MARSEEAEKWNKRFGSLLGCALKFHHINRAKLAEELDVSESAIRQWISGRNFPETDCMGTICEILPPKINKVSAPAPSAQMKQAITDTLSAFSDYIVSERDDLGKYVVAALELCYNCGKGFFPPMNVSAPTGQTQMVVFDFDGTLTEQHGDRTTWESIWTSLGYDVDECRRLHDRYNRRQISHPEWCALTAEKFRKRRLRIDTINKIASEIRLLDGCEETFRTLKENNIRIYIVSGSIREIIRRVIRGLAMYVDDIKANDFQFSPDGSFVTIIGTKYDFEGKANFILKLSKKLHISPKDILFFGNSHNGKYVSSMSGAKTLCINPRRTDPTDLSIWDSSILECRNLTEILSSVDFPLTECSASSDKNLQSV